MTDEQLIEWAKPDRVLVASESADTGRYLAIVREVLVMVAGDPEAPTSVEVMCACDVAANLWSVATDNWTIRAERESVRARELSRADALRAERVVLEERGKKRSEHRKAIGEALAVVRALRAMRDARAPSNVLPMKRRA